MHDGDAVIALELLRHGPRAGRAADDDALQGRELAAGLLEVASSASQTVGTAAVTRDRSASPAARGPRRRRASGRACTSVAPAIGAEKAKRPAVGVEQRHDRHRHVAATKGRGSRRMIGHQRVQHVGAVRVEHALRIARRAGGVAHARPRCSRRSRPARNRRRPRPASPRRRTALRRLVVRHVGGIGQDDVALDRWAAAARASPPAGTKVRSRKSSRSSAWLMM